MGASSARKRPDSEATARLLNLEECAERTGTTVRWWRRAVFQRRVPVVKVGRLVRIDERDFENLLASWRIPAENERSYRQPARRRGARRKNSKPRLARPDPPPSIVSLPPSRESKAG